MREAFRVLITGVGGAGIGHEVLKALRMARESRYHVTACDMSAVAFGFRDADVRYVVPPAADPGYVERLLEVARREGTQVIIPGSEAELRVLSSERAALASLGIVLLANDQEVIATCLDKIRTMAALSACGFRTPRWIPGNADALEDAIDWEVSIVKPVSGGGGSNLCFIAQSPQETRLFAEYVTRAGYMPMVQEYVGNATEEYTVGVLHTLHGQQVASVALRRDILTALSNRIRLRARTGQDGEWLAVSSGVSQGAIVDAPAVRRDCEAIAEALGSRGPLNIQLRLVGEAIVPFEINPRFSGTTCFRALAGCNEPDLLIRHHVLGEALPEVRVRPGRALRALEEYFVPDA